MRKLSIPTNVPEILDRTSPHFQYYRSQNDERIQNFTPTSDQKKVSLKFPGYTNNKEIIRRIANGYCGYCGTLIKNRTIVVEHYRPKAQLDFRENEISLEQVHEDEQNRKAMLKKPAEKCTYGYYKWGDDINNLIPACDACNSGQGKDAQKQMSAIYVAKKRGHDINRGNIEYGIPYGKDNFFPILYTKHDNTTGKLIDHRYRLLYINDITHEIPLLFNPYLDDPDILFDYKNHTSADTTGRIIKIRPSKKGTKLERLKAEVSINLLGLNRSTLCHARYDKFNEISRISLDMKDAITSGDYSLSRWAPLTLSFSKEFISSNADLLGYGERIGKGVAFKIREVIVDHVANSPDVDSSMFTDSIIFQILNQELDDFARVHENANDNLGIVIFS